MHLYKIGALFYLHDLLHNLIIENGRFDDILLLKIVVN